jgi:NADH dehydrogenase
MTRVVVVGAGFAGLECAKELRGAPVEVTVVDRNNFHTFTALLYQVATAELSPAEVGFPVRTVFRRAGNISVRRGAVTGVDWTGRTVEVDRGAPLPFDHLVLAAGATTNWFGVPGAEEHGFPLYSMGDALRLRNHLLGQFESADVDNSLVAQGALTVVIVGGGPTGVEMAGALVELIRKVLAEDFRGLEVGRARVVLVEQQDAVLGAFSGPSQRHAAEELRGLGVELRLGERVEAVTADGVQLAGGEVLPARTLVWAAGTRANPLAAQLGVAVTVGGRVVVGPDLRIPDHPEAFVIGDLAALPGPGGSVLPQLAPVAQQSGRFVGRAIARLAEGRPPGRFRYRDLGTMATIGRRQAVADLPWGLRLSGTVGWLAWVGLHLWRLVGVRNRLAVFLNWTWNYLTWERGSRLIVSPTESRHGERVP